MENLTEPEIKVERWKNLRELDTFYRNQNNSYAVESFDFLKKKLIEHGFEADLKRMDSYIETHPKFLEQCYQIQLGLNKNQSIIIMSPDVMLLEGLFSFLPILYSLNTRGNSVFRINTKILIDQILTPSLSSEELVKRMSRNLVLVSNLFSGDNRLISMAPSIEGIIIDLLLKRRMIFTAHTTCAQEPEARKDIIYRLGTIYSPTLVEYFKENVFPIYLKKESLASMWD